MMNSFLIKIIVMPLVIAMVTQISRKWGNAVGGIVASLPWVAGPIIFFITLEQGIDFAMSTIPGVMIGLISWLTFCLAYVTVGRRYNAAWSLLSGYISYLLTGALLNNLTSVIGLNVWMIAAILLMLGTLYIFPTPGPIKAKAVKTLKYDIPLRMIMITAFVVGITFFADKMGPTWSGILTPFPIMTAVLAIFTHYSQGIEGTILILKGLLLGIFGFVAFMYLLVHTLPVVSIGQAFLISSVANLIITFGTKQLSGRIKV